MKPSTHIENLIRKQLKGTISNDEQKELNSWYSEDLDKDYTNIYSNKNTSKENVKRRMLNKIIHEINYSKNPLEDSSRFFRVFSKVAILLIFLTAGYAIYNLSTNSTEKKNKYITKVVERGEKSKITLMDGTVIWLNSQSVLKFPSKFNKDKREIELEGEGYFEVTHNKDHPFVIKTANTITTVLGTSFNIRAYESDKTSIAVNFGEVIVKIPEESSQKSVSYVLKKNEQVIYNKETHAGIKEKTNSSNNSSWIHGILNFDGNDLVEVAEVLERWFDVDIRLKNVTSSSCKLYGQYKGEKLRNVLESLKYTLNISYEIKENSVIIDAKNCL